QQRGLARAVAAHEAHLVGGSDVPVHATEERFAPRGEGGVVQSDQAASQTASAIWSRPATRCRRCEAWCTPVGVGRRAALRLLGTIAGAWLLLFWVDTGLGLFDEVVAQVLGLHLLSWIRAMT